MFDYTCIGPNWTREYITAGLDITSNELRKIFDEAGMFFVRNPDIVNLRSTRSKNIVRAFANKLRQKHPAVFRNVPADTLWDREIAMGIMRFASHNRPPSQARTQTPNPWTTPTRDPVTSPLFTTSTSPPGEEIPESRLLMQFEKGFLGSAQKLECTAEGIAEMNPARPDDSVIIIKYITRDNVVQMLTDEGLMDTNTDSIIGVKENGERIVLSSTLRLVGFLRSRCIFGSLHAYIFTAPASPVVTNPPHLPPPTSSPAHQAPSDLLKGRKDPTEPKLSGLSHSLRRTRRRVRKDTGSDSDDGGPVKAPRELKRRKLKDRPIRMFSSEDDDDESMSGLEGAKDMTLVEKGAIGKEDKPQDLGVGADIIQEDDQQDRPTWQTA